MTSSWIYYFGYGSLVNRETRPADEFAVNATLYGWRRVWHHRVRPVPDGRCGCTSLSIERFGDEMQYAGALPGIDGVLVKVHTDHVPALDKRESGYRRLRLSDEQLRIPPDCDDLPVYAYQSLPENRQPAEADFPLLQSYVDCVMAGYLDRFGMDGLTQLLQTTLGWDKPIRNDRQSPQYPRHTVIARRQLDLFDELLENAINACRP